MEEGREEGREEGEEEEESSWRSGRRLWLVCLLLIGSLSLSRRARSTLLRVQVFKARACALRTPLPLPSSQLTNTI